MAFTIGTVRCQCSNTMGMPSDSGECVIEGCNAKKTFWGDKSFSRLEEWAREHSAFHVENLAKE